MRTRFFLILLLVVCAALTLWILFAAPPFGVSDRHAYLAGAAAGLWVLAYRPGVQ